MEGKPPAQMLLRVAGLHVGGLRLQGVHRVDAHDPPYGMDNIRRTGTAKGDSPVREGLKLLSQGSYRKIVKVGHMEIGNGFILCSL